jgi:hypothetical protein
MMCIKLQHQHMQQVGLVQALLKAAAQAHNTTCFIMLAYDKHQVVAPALAAGWSGAGPPQSCKASAQRNFFCYVGLLCWPLLCINLQHQHMRHIASCSPFQTL